MIALSPSTVERLDRWLETDPDRFERYLRSHPEVGDFYENLHGLSTAVKSALADAVSAPFDLAARFWDRAAEKTDTEASAVVLDLFGVGIGTLWALFDGDIS